MGLTAGRRQHFAGHHADAHALLMAALQHDPLGRLHRLDCDQGGEQDSPCPRRQCVLMPPHAEKINWHTILPAQRAGSHHDASSPHNNETKGAHFHSRQRLHAFEQHCEHGPRKNQERTWKVLGAIISIVALITHKHVVVFAFGHGAIGSQDRSQDRSERTQVGGKQRGCREIQTRTKASKGSLRSFPF
jgi:hypothetical protein